MQDKENETQKSSGIPKIMNKLPVSFSIFYSYVMKKEFKLNRNMGGSRGGDRGPESPWKVIWVSMGNNGAPRGFGDLGRMAIYF